jgi:exosortase
MLSSASQHVAAVVAQRTLDLCGIPVVREGLTLHIGRVDLEVTEACNGLRFLFASVIVGLAIAWALPRRRPAERVLVVALALVAGLAANLVRVTGTAMLAWVEPTAVIGTPHLVFGKAVYLAIGVAVALTGATLLRRSLRAA